MDDNITSGDVSGKVSSEGSNQTESNDQILICSFNCSEQNVHKCRKCERPFCVMHSNKFSPNFCQDCFKNLSAVEEKFHRTFDDYDTKTDKLTIHKQTNTRYYMDGADWPFVQLWIHELSDEELRTWWIFHYSIMKSIEAENEVRKVRKAKHERENPSVKFVSSVQKKSNSTTKVTKAVDTPDQLRAKLKKQGLPDTVIDMMIKTMAGG